mgnify:CR=1 FL=1
MYLRVEENIVVNTKDIIGIFDMDNTTVSRLGRNFLAESQKNGLIINSTDDLPKSFVVVKEKDESFYILRFFKSIGKTWFIIHAKRIKLR